VPSEPARPTRAVPSLDGASFRAAVATAKEHIAAGDIFQVVLARRWKAPARVEPLALYRALRMINPSPYMVLVETPDVALVGASPEMLVRVGGRRVETRPIAGTRPRGVDADGDARLAEDLLADPKERAEHVMLVDLGRNDLGRVAVPGTVRVRDFMTVERYSHVMHLVSSVEADLAPEHGALDALLACFPAGTVSGAPKIRAMEIVDDLEPEARGPYAGAVGYVSFSGDLDTCIAIRTLVVREGEVSVTAGAGIVADSDPAAEERETESKAAALLHAVALAERIADQRPRKAARRGRRRAAPGSRGGAE
jgi:anthranilate synthase component 1